MRAAPPVSVRCNGGPAWRALYAFVPAAAATAVVAWLLGHAGLNAAAAWGVLPALGALLWRRPPAPQVLLAWDGQTWSADAQPGRLAVMIDIGPWLLLRLHPLRAGRSRWLPLAAVEAGPALHALRAALYARTGTADAASPPQAA